MGLLSSDALGEMEDRERVMPVPACGSGWMYISAVWRLDAAAVRKWRNRIVKASRSIGAVAAGLVTLAALCMLTDKLLVAAHLFPSPAAHRPYTLALLAIVVAYCTVYTLMGGYVTARLAPTRPVAHAVVLGVLGMALSTLGTMHQWQIGNGWNTITLVAEGIPLCWVGALLWTRWLRLQRNGSFASGSLT
jgi:hypothetical protein